MSQLLFFFTLGHAPAALANEPGAIKKTPPAFKLHLTSEPAELNPQSQKSSAANYLLGNLYRNLLKFDDQKGLIPDLAETCKINKNTITCTLKKNLKWSDGQKLVAADFLNTYKSILTPDAKILRADLLFEVTNAKNFYSGQSKSFGIKAADDKTLIFEIDKSASAHEFLYNLANLILAPYKAGTQSFSGPYKLKQWLPRQKIILTANEYYPNANKQRPDVEFYFIEEDSVALQLYEKNELDLLRRLPTLYLTKFKSRADFQSIPMIRFDYLSYGPEAQKDLQLKVALSHSLNYPELQTIFASVGTPGCMGVPSAWTNKDLCYAYDLSKAKRAWEQASANKKTELQLLYSSLGGDDHKRATEWMQNQWLQAGIKVQPRVRDNKVFLSEIKNLSNEIYRKGHSPDRPLCSSVLELFSDTNQEETLRIQDSEFTKILHDLKNETHTQKQQDLCTRGLQFILDKYTIIPLGRYEFSMLIRPQFKGWRFNLLNQLDLADLSYSQSK